MTMSIIYKGQETNANKDNIDPLELKNTDVHIRNVNAPIA